MSPAAEPSPSKNEPIRSSARSSRATVAHRRGTRFAGREAQETRQVFNERRDGTRQAQGLAAPPQVPRKAAPAVPEEPDVPPLTAEQIEGLRKELEERRAALLINIDERREQERDQGREVGDEMDDASLEGTTSMTSKLLERDARLLAEINRALAKLRDGTSRDLRGHRRADRLRPPAPAPVGPLQHRLPGRAGARRAHPRRSVNHSPVPFLGRGKGLVSRLRGTHHR